MEITTRHLYEITNSEVTLYDVIAVTNVTSFITEENNSTNLVPPDKDTTIHWIYFVLAGVVIFGGLIFDMLSIVVFATSRTLRRTTTGHYLIALMVADTCFLLGELLRWLTYSIDGVPVLGLTFTSQYDGACRTAYFIRYSAKLTSAWLTVVITLERYLTVSMPLRVGQISTTTKAKALIAGLTVACIVLGAFPFWTVGVGVWDGVNYCVITDELQYEKWLMAILRVGSLFLPCVIIFLLTVAIIVHLYRADRKRQKMSSMEGKSIQKQLTAMLLAVAISFIVLRLPYTTFWYLNNYAKDLQLSRVTEDWIYRARYITEVIAMANYASNFFLFCVCGSAFREQLGKFCRRGKKNKQRHLSSNTLSTRAHSSYASRDTLRKDNVSHTHTAKTSSGF